MGGVPGLEEGGGSNTAVWGRADFLAAGAESPLRNSEGVGGSAFLERRRNSACVLLGGGKHRLFLVLCPRSQRRKVSPARFQQVHSCRGPGLLGCAGASRQHRAPVPEVCWSWAGSELYPVTALTVTSLL